MSSRYSGYKRRSTYRRTYPIAKKYNSNPGFTRFGSGYSKRWNTRSSILKAANVELKFHDTTPDSGEIEEVGGYIHNLNLIAIGASPDQRIGRKIVVKQIAGNLIIDNKYYEGDEVAISVILDKQCNGQDPNMDDIFTGGKPYDFPDIYNSKRFQILYNKFFALNSMNYTAEKEAGENNQDKDKYARINKTIAFKIKCNIPIDFNDTIGNANIAMIRSNNLLLVARSVHGTSKVTGKTRIMFSDY